MTALQGACWTGTGRSSPRPRKPGPELRREAPAGVRREPHVERREASAPIARCAPRFARADGWCASRRSIPLGHRSGGTGRGSTTRAQKRAARTMEAALNPNRNRRAGRGRSPASARAAANKQALMRLEAEREARRRWQCELFQFWRVCARSQCHRARACSGDPAACVERGWPQLPEECRVWYRAAITALAGGASPQAADAAGREAARVYCVQAAQAARRGRCGATRFSAAGSAAPAGDVMSTPLAPPSPRVRGEGRGEGASPMRSESRRGPLTRGASRHDLSPHAGRGVQGAPPQLRHVRRCH